MKKYLMTTVCIGIIALAGNVFASENIKKEMEGNKPQHEMRMQETLAEKLKLTPEQREQAKKIHEDGRNKMKPLIKERKELHEKMNNLRRENMEEFNKILNDEQKKQFEEIKAEHKKKFHNKKHHKPRHFRGKPIKNDTQKK